jgi:uncharacterized membrane protein
MAKGDLIKQFLDEEQLARIGRAVGECEKATSGEVRVVIREKKDWVARLLRLSLRRLVVEEFHRLWMHKTRERTGVILYFLLEDRQFYIYGDKGIHAVVGQETWDRVVAEVAGAAKEQNLCEGILLGLERIGAILAGSFPIKPGDVNELPNEVELR